uniref:F-box/LRR-repeat protein 15/At3g58940/PEG3-like LRR domain-containing protein n=1 Tax=Oryza barthii TaxID=65489 RepID=A0A0D3GS60_9ORYZ
MAYRCIAHKKASLSGGSVGAGAGGGRGYGGPDRISRLPDELLHHILSFVTTPEAISLYSSGMAVRLPALDDNAAGNFTRLTRLHMSELRFSDAGEGISGVVSRRCPSLECLELEHIAGVEALTLRSESLLSLRLASVSRLRRLEVEAGNLRRMRVEYCFDETRSCRPWNGGGAAAVMRLYAPALEELGWEDACPDEVEWIRLPTCLSELIVRELPSHIIRSIGQSDFTKILELFSGADVLKLTSPMTATLDSEEQESLIYSVQLPYYSELDLGVIAKGHKSYGSSVVHFLKRNSSIRNLTLTLHPYHPEDKRCAPCCMSNCNCHEPLKWWDEDISLDSLEQLCVKHIWGECEGKRLIYFIMRNSKVLKKITVVFSTSQPTASFDILLSANMIIPLDVSMDGPDESTGHFGFRYQHTIPPTQPLKRTPVCNITRDH